MKIKYCIDCGKEVKYSDRCRVCARKNYLKNNKNILAGSNNPNWRGGVYFKENKCPVCQIKIGPYSKYCKKHFIVLFEKDKKVCMDCGAVVKNNHAKRCRTCAGKERTKIFEKSRKKCVDCGKPLSIKKYERCHACNNKYQWGIGDYREKVLQKLILSPNKPEKLLSKLLNKIDYKRWRYVGDGKFWIKRFNPDFVNSKKKEIIEMYGNYWHNLEKNKKKDEERIKTYLEFGYKCLIIWEHELKDLEKLTNKVLDFAYPQVKSI